MELREAGSDGKRLDDGDSRATVTRLWSANPLTAKSRQRAMSELHPLDGT